MFHATHVSFLQPEVLSAQFSHMTLAQQPPGDGAASTPEGRHYPPMYGSHPSPMVLQGAAPQQVTGYMVAGPSGGVPVQLPGQAPNHAYPSSNSAVFSAAPLNQPLLQQHTYIQQPVQQVTHPSHTRAGTWRPDFCFPDGSPSQIFAFSSRFPRVTAPRATIHTAPISSSTTGPPPTPRPTTARRARTCPSNKVRSICVRTEGQQPTRATQTPAS